MGFSNGTSKTDKRVEKGGHGPQGPQGDRGIGFHLIVDSHFHIKNKRLTNVSPPVDDHDATTKKFVADLLKTKAGTTYVKNELAKKVNKSTLSDYVLKSDLNQTISDLNKTISDLNKTISAIKPNV